MSALTTTLPRVSAAVEEKECSADDADSASCHEHHEHALFDDASSKEGIQFLQKKVFGQKKDVGSDDEEGSFSHLNHHAATSSEDAGKTAPKKVSEQGILSKLATIAKSDQPEDELLEFILSSTQDDEVDDGTTDTKKMFQENAKEIMAQLGRVFADKIGEFVTEFSSIPGLWYYLRRDEELKTGAWKRRQHFYFKKLEEGVAVLQELHRALYLSHLAYVDTEEEVLEGLKTFDGNRWELFYSDTEGQPAEPAHFFAIHKQAAQFKKSKKPKSKLPWKRAVEEDELEVMLVVRGTKSLGDMLSDGLLEAVDYRGYKAHGGIMKSGTYIADKHLNRLRDLLEASGRSKLKLWIFGHSLGAGTAAIAAMEFNDHDFIDVSAVGFGCPALVSPELSEKYSDIITTVVSDADIVPRMSGSSLANLKLETMKFDYTDMARSDFDGFMENLTKDLQFGKSTVQKQMEQLNKVIESNIQSKVKPKMKRADATITKALPDGVPLELIPPGSCIHLYRNGVGYDARYTPCSFFDEVEYVLHCVDDHYCDTGYHWALLNLLRQEENDVNAVFANAI
jgi:hypothetical protein